MHTALCPWPTDRPARSATAGEGTLGVPPALHPANSAPAVRGARSSWSAPGDVYLRSRKPQLAESAKATHLLKLHLIRTSLVFQQLGHHPPAA